MLSWFTLASILLLFTAIPLEANSNQKECGDLNLATPFSYPTGKGSGSSLGNNCPDVLCSSTNLEQEVQASSFAKVRVNNSIYGCSNCSFYTGAGAKMLQSHEVHAAMNLKDHTTSSTIANNFTTVIGYESFGFIGYEPLTLNINSPLADQEDGACSGIGYCHSSIPRRIEYSFAKEAESIANITLLSMYIWFTMKLGVTGTPSKSSLILLSMVGNVSSARQPYYEKIAVLRNHSKRSVHSLIEVGTRDNCFGMVLLEIVTGEKPIYFGRPESQRIISSHFVLSMELQSGLFDQIVGTQVLKQEQEEEQVRAVAELAKRCLSLSSAERPAMEEVARELTMLRS
ncbi:hypothetical protein ACLB2K_070797 [Fragaria x ananassa]